MSETTLQEKRPLLNRTVWGMLMLLGLAGQLPGR